MCAGGRKNERVGLLFLPTVDFFGRVFSVTMMLPPRYILLRSFVAASYGKLLEPIRVLGTAWTICYADLLSKGPHFDSAPYDDIVF